MMSQKEVLEQLEEVLEVNDGSLTMDMKLDNLEEYDSMAKLSLIVMSDDDFDKKLTAEQINEFKTVGDIVHFLSV